MRIVHYTANEGVHYTVYFLNITMMINQENGKEVRRWLRSIWEREGWNRG